MAPRVSVLVAAYNAEPYVGEALQSVLDQTFQDFEVIVLDDGSTDRTADAVAAIDDPRIRLVRRPHRGLAACRNELLRLARGEYVAVLDADDVAMPERLAKQVAFLDAHPDVGAVGGWLESFGLVTGIDRRPVDDASIRALLRLGTAVADGAATARRRLLLDVGGYDETALWVDWEINLKIAAVSKLHNLPEVVIRYRRHRESMQKAVPRAVARKEKVRRRVQAARVLGWRLDTIVYLAATKTAIALYEVIDRRRPAALPPVRRFSVIVPSRERPERLAACLDGLAVGTRAPDETIVVILSSDRASAAALESWSSGDGVRRVVTVDRPGQVEALRAGLAHATGDVVCFLDDDAVPAKRWLEHLAAAYGPAVAGAGGRVVDVRGERRVEGRTRRVGRVTWYGRVVGRHHLDAPAQRCHWATGGNSSYRRSLVELDTALVPNAHGVQFANDVAIGLAARASGHQVWFVPEAVIEHRSASPRDAATGMRTSTAGDVEAAAHNLLVAVCRQRAPAARVVAYAYWFAIGTSTAPGPLRALAGAAAGRPALLARVGPATRGKRRAVATLREPLVIDGASERRGDAALSGKVAVLSAHLDDAIFSLGASIASAVDAGAFVKVVTVLAGDPTSTRPAGAWDAAAGFKTWGEAVRARCREDRRACEIVGAVPVWLPFGDEQYGRGADDDAVWAALAEEIGDADAVLVPGFPLTHPDHAWLVRLVAGRLVGARLGLYLEQPYATITHGLGRPDVAGALTGVVDGDVDWTTLTCAPEHARAKRAAMRAYRSQLRLITLRPLLARRVTRYGARRGGELVAWVSRVKENR